MRLSTVGGIAMLQNRAGDFLLLDASTAEAAAKVKAPKTRKNERTSLIYAPGANSYPKLSIPSEPQATVRRPCGRDATVFTWRLATVGMRLIS